MAVSRSRRRRSDRAAGSQTNRFTSQTPAGSPRAGFRAMQVRAVALCSSDGASAANENFTATTPHGEDASDMLVSSGGAGGAERSLGGEGGIRTLEWDLKSVSSVFSMRPMHQIDPMRLWYCFRLLPRPKAARVPWKNRWRSNPSPGSARAPPQPRQTPALAIFGREPWNYRRMEQVSRSRPGALFHAFNMRELSVRNRALPNRKIA
jgi:hypothetical protein